MKIALLLSFTLSMTLFTASHPVMIMILTMAQTLMICMMIWISFTSPWFAYILFLIFIGGLMVLFIYITSLASNEKFNFTTKKEQIKSSYLMVLALMATLYMMFKSMNNSFTPSIYSQVNPIFNTLMSSTTLLIMTYLLVTLIVAVKIASKMEGPLRNILKK